jgi:hypothetical protein
MVLLYSQVPKISVKRNRTADVFPDGVFIHLEIMLAAFGFLYVDDLQAVPLNDGLRLQRVPFFFLNKTLSGGFWCGL